MFPYEASPEQAAKVGQEYDLLRAEFQKWCGENGGLIPPAIAAFAEGLYNGCARRMAELEAEDKTELSDKEPIIAFSSTLSFGMYLGMLGYKPEDMTMPNVLTSEDERKLLGEGPTD